MKYNRLFLAAIVLLAVSSVFASSNNDDDDDDSSEWYDDWRSSKLHALDEYVRRPDGSFSWTLNQTFNFPDYTLYTLRLTSLTWNILPSNNPVWKHWMQVCVPKTVKAELGFLYINDDLNSFKPNGTSLDADLELIPKRICVEGGAVTTILWQIPNEPITFNDEPGNPRVEDAIIAYTWRKFIDNPDKPEKVLQFPMTKAAVRSLDATQDFVKSLKHPKVPKPKNFVVAGASKRGWITWLIGAVDERVVGIVPIVIPVANLVENFNSVYQNIGEWGFALADYTALNIFDFLNNASITPLVNVIDPLVYNDRYKNKDKLVVVGTTDEFFTPDQPNFFFTQLKGPKWLHLSPNADHPMAGFEAKDTIYSFFKAVNAKHTRFPHPNWVLVPSNSSARPALTFAGSDLRPTKVIQWTGTTNPGKNRDFRLITCPEIPDCLNIVPWIPSIVSEVAPGTNLYLGQSEAPPAGQWTGFFLEFVYDLRLPDGSTTQFNVTTEVNIIPTYRPFPQYQPPTH
jgi:PhoPQ-activated pathogenicity-related protein